jgi:hypothetical protein
MMEKVARWYLRDPGCRWAATDDDLAGQRGANAHAPAVVTQRRALAQTAEERRCRSPESRRCRSQKVRARCEQDSYLRTGRAATRDAAQGRQREPAFSELAIERKRSAASPCCPWEHNGSSFEAEHTGLTQQASTHPIALPWCRNASRFCPGVMPGWAVYVKGSVIPSNFDQRVTTK